MIKNVILKPNAGKHQIWIAQSYLKQVAEDLSENYLRKARCMSKDTGGWRWTLINNQYYYDYDKIPDKSPKNYKSKLPAQDELIRMARAPFDDDQILLRARIKLEREVKKYEQQEDLQFFLYESSPTFNFEKAMQLMEAVAWARLLWKVCCTEDYILYGLNTVKIAYEVGASILAEKQLQGMKLSTAMSLRLKLREFPIGGTKKEQCAFVIGTKYGNDNRRIVGKQTVIDEYTGEVMPFDAHQAAIYGSWMNIGAANKLYKKYLFEQKYCPMMTEMGLKSVSYRTFCAHTDEIYAKVFMSKERDGDKAFNRYYKTYMPCLPLEFANSLWVADGSGTKLRYQKNTATGVKAGTMYMVRVHDVATRALLGYSISPTGETKEMVLAALKMAVETSGGYLPLDFLSDNGSSFTESSIKERLTVLLPKVRNIKPGNSQENIAETYVRLFTEMGRPLENWGGTGFNAKSLQHLANPDYQHIDKLPTEELAYSQLLNLIDAWNNSPGADGLSPMERFKATRNEKSTQATEIAHRFAFGHETRIDLAKYRGFVVVHHDAKRYHFTIPDIETNLQVISAALGYVGHAEVQIRWDLKGADIYTPDGKFILNCPPTDKAHKSEAEATSDTFKAMGEHARRKMAMNDKADYFRDKVGETLAAIPAKKEVVSGEHEMLNYDEMTAYSNGRVKTAYNAQMDAEAEKKYTTKKGGNTDTRTDEQKALDDIFF